jgi:hypothetical protein
MDMDDIDRNTQEKLMQVQNEFMQEAKYELQIFNLKEQYETEAELLKSRITKLREDLFLKELYIRKLHLELQDKDATINLLSTTNRLSSDEDVTLNWLALQRILTVNL